MRCAAARCLGEGKHYALAVASTHLLPLLHDSDDDVRREVAAALGHMGPDGGSRFAPDLVRSLTDDSEVK